jgi:excinuclease UvrABC nuclease subunit
MELNEYQKGAMSTCMESSNNVAYMLTGLTAEVGEVNDKIAKAIRKGKIRIDNNQAVFSLIGNIQEQTHDFAISYHRKLRSKRLRYSQLDAIAGIGEKRKQALLKEFKSVTAIRNATMEELQRVLPGNAALSVYKHFHNEE